MNNGLEQQLRRYIMENFLFTEAFDYRDDDSFVENGIIDSTGVLELVSHVQGAFGIRIEDKELVPENLDSISRLARFIRQKTEGGP